ncbi:MAG: hypothetical protein NZ823_07000 [Blastocatellia bacterium]|nr:hypothetical protein [Blastocatellia bacterium]
MKTLTFQVSDEVYEACQQMAAKYGGTTEQYVLEFLAKHRPKPRLTLTEEESREAWERLLRHAGAENLGYVTGADNESIDADLAREYASTHEEG